MIQLAPESVELLNTSETVHFVVVDDSLMPLFGPGAKIVCQPRAVLVTGRLAVVDVNREGPECLQLVRVEIQGERWTLQTMCRENQPLKMESRPRRVIPVQLVAESV